MNHKQAKNIVMVCNAVSIFLFFFVITFGTKLLVDYLMPLKPKKIPFVFAQPKPKQKMERTQSLYSFQSCWNLKVETPYKKEHVRSVPVIKQKKTMVNSNQLPFSWVSTIVHSNPQKSYAIVENKRTRKQILLKNRSFVQLQNSKMVYRVDSIRRKQIVFTWGKKKAVLKPQKKKQHLGKFLPSSKLTLKLKRKLYRHGLREDDGIISVAGKRVSSASQLYQYIIASEKSLVEISIRREGRILSLYVPKD